MGARLASLALACALLAACDQRHGAAPVPAPSTPSPPRGELVDINRASQAELEALPAIGRAYAHKIVAGRPYDNKAQLVSRGVLPESVYARVAPMLIAHRRAP